MPATGARSGTPALSSESVDAQTEPIEIDPLEPSASETCRMAYGNSSRLGSTGTRARPAGLAGRVGREVVVVHVPLARLGRERVQLLLHAQHVQRGDAEDLGLATLEQRRAVHAREHLDLR